VQLQPGVTLQQVPGIGQVARVMRAGERLLVQRDIHDRVVDHREKHVQAHAGDRSFTDSQTVRRRFATRRRQSQRAIIKFRVDDVDGKHARLQDLVENWVQEPTTMPWGNRSVLFRDPTETSSTYSHPSPRKRSSAFKGASAP
jgi:hypothetical protein